MADRRRVTRIVYGLYIVGVAAFVVSCIWQVAKVVFGPEGTPTATAESPIRVEFACGEGLKELMGGVDLALLEALGNGGERAEDAGKRYATARDAKWSRRAAIEEACAKDPNGADALAAVARYDRVAQTTVIRHATELTPVRIQAQSFISGHPR